MVADDWQTLKDLRLQALTESSESFLGDLLAEQDYDEKHWRQELSRNVWLMATFDTRKIGLAKLNHNVQPDDGMHLEALWVAPDNRRQKVGKLLVSALENIAAAMDAPQLKLWVFAENDLAREFYLQMGYMETLRKQPIKANGRIRLEEEYQKQL
ncbi:GNAT family N-acetyltransferase [Kribbella caucasensis]|uniref:GNAT family N-acetyltransferase n=1 Tax=Kribbella caucasensis TaxID=2512215 RepID=UPI0014150621|nr:GNAT family N-acetyltransferase [Kribbella sp. VKM Ac-2527]